MRRSGDRSAAKGIEGAVLAGDNLPLRRLAFHCSPIVGCKLGTAISALDGDGLAPRRSKPPALGALPINVAIQVMISMIPFAPSVTRMFKPPSSTVRNGSDFLNSGCI
jgi:hypothetical protein